MYHLHNFFYIQKLLLNIPRQFGKIFHECIGWLFWLLGKLWVILLRKHFDLDSKKKHNRHKIRIRLSPSALNAIVSRMTKTLGKREKSYPRKLPYSFVQQSHINQPTEMRFSSFRSFFDLMSPCFRSLRVHNRAVLSRAELSWAELSWRGVF